MITQKVNVGTVANDGTGDTIRASFIKYNSNFETVDIMKEDIDNNKININNNTDNINLNNIEISKKANEIDVLKRDGSVKLNSDYTPSVSKDIATKEYVDNSTNVISLNTSNISSNTLLINTKANEVDVLKRDGSVKLNLGYVPISNLDIATKIYVDDATKDISTNTNKITLNSLEIENKANEIDVLKKDGSVSMRVGYSPNIDLDLTTKKYVDDKFSIVNNPGISKSDELNISIDIEKFTDGLTDFNQSDWNARAKNKIESNTTQIGSRALQSDLDLLATRITTAEASVAINRNSINNLATVSNSGSYNDLFDKPIIPSVTNDLLNNSGFITDISGFNTDELWEGNNNKYDKTVILTGGTGINITGVYPNFTISNTDAAVLPKGYINGGVIKNNSVSPLDTIDISACIARSLDNTIDLNIEADSLNITLNISWASGTVSSLASTAIHIWADYNYGTERFILDDSTGSNISGPKRRVGSFITDSSSEIISFIASEQSGGRIDIDFSSEISLVLNSQSNTSPALINTCCPAGINTKFKGYLQTLSYASTSGTRYCGVRIDTSKLNVMRNNAFYAFCYRIYGEKTACLSVSEVEAVNGQIWYQGVNVSDGGKHSVFQTGYIDERI